MKIALFVAAMPFIRGGTEVLVESLKDQLDKRGHMTKIFRLPLIDDHETGIFLSALSCQLLDFSDYDVLISFKWPTYLAVHKQKVIWMFHQFRQVYDLFGTPYGIINDNTGKAIREMVIQTDRAALGNAGTLFALSNAAKRLKEYSGISTDILYTPLGSAEDYHYSSTGDFIYCASRIDCIKRQFLAVEAMLYVKSEAKLVLDGKCSDDRLLDEMRTYINKHGLGDKVKISEKFVPEETKIERYANCLAGIYLPLDEDSPGIVTLEVMYSRKTLITTSDSGGVADFVQHGDTAFVVEPTPQAVAGKIDYLFDNKETARQMGENAYKYVAGKNINWDDTIRRLLR